MRGASRTKAKYMGCSLDDEDDWHQFRNGKLVPSSLHQFPVNWSRLYQNLIPLSNLIPKLFELRSLRPQHLQSGKIAAAFVYQILNDVQG